MWPILLFFLPLLLLLLTKSKRSKNLKLIPGPPKLPIIGHLHLIGESPHQSFWELSKKYGPVYRLELGQMPNIVVSSAEAAKEVMKVHDLVCCSRPQLYCTGKLTYNHVDVAFSPYSTYWRDMRKVVVLELFSLKRVQSFRFLREEETDLLLNYLFEAAASATPVDMTEKLFAYTSTMTFRMVFGISYRGSNFDRDAFHHIVHETAAVMGSLSAQEYFPRVGKAIDWLTGFYAKTDKVFKKLDNFFQHCIDDHLKPGADKKKEHEDMIDALLKIKNLQNESGETWFTNDNIKAVLLNLFLGGVDTTATTVNWTMAELAKNPKIMKKAQEEVRKRVGNKGKVTESELDDLEYMRLIIKESLRLHPPVPLLVARETMDYCKIGGYDIDPKTVIQVNAWGIGRDPKYWKDAEEFIPERHIDSPVDFRGNNFEFLPFGSGRRICPGMNMGLITVEIVLANLLYCFDWKLPIGMKEEDIDMLEKPGMSLTLCKKNPLMLVPVKYNP